MLLCSLAVLLLGLPRAEAVTAVVQASNFTITYSPGLGVVPTPLSFSISSISISEFGVADDKLVVGATASCTAGGTSVVPAHIAEFLGLANWTCSGGGGSGQLFVMQSGAHAAVFWTGARTIVSECVVQYGTTPPNLVTSATFTCIGPAAAA